jgi:hypothetical protein
MPNSPPTATAASSSANFQVIFNNALKAYERRTKKDLLSHPLAVELQTCNSPTAILAVLRQQVQGPDPSSSSDDRWTKWLEPTVNVLKTFSDTLGEGVSLVSFGTLTLSEICSLMFTRQVFAPGKVIFAGVGVLLQVRIFLNDMCGSSKHSSHISQTAIDVQKSHETLIDIFGRIETCFQRIEIYTQVRPTTEMMDTIIQIMVEVLTILGIATKEMKQSRISQ